MDLFFSSPEPIDRDEALSALQASISDFLGRPIRVTAAEFIDNRLADFFACDESGTIYALRWVETEDLVVGLFSLLEDYYRIQTHGREILRRHFSATPVEDAELMRLILVGETIPDRVLEVAATFAFPIQFFKVHRVRTPDPGRDGLYFELRSARVLPGSASSEETPSEVPPAPSPAQPKRQPGPGDIYAGLSTEEIAAFKTLEMLLSGSGAQSPQS